MGHARDERHGDALTIGSTLRRPPWMRNPAHLDPGLQAAPSTSPDHRDRRGRLSRRRQYAIPSLRLIAFHRAALLPIRRTQPGVLSIAPSGDPAAERRRLLARRLCHGGAPNAYECKHWPILARDAKSPRCVWRLESRNRGTGFEAAARHCGGVATAQGERHWRRAPPPNATNQTSIACEHGGLYRSASNEQAGL